MKHFCLVRAFAQSSKTHEITQGMTVTLTKKLSEIYASEMKKRGAVFQWKIEWSNQQQDLRANQPRRAKVFEIRVLGGFVRHKQMTKDALVLALCHEIGHHIGGAPMVAKPASIGIFRLPDYSFMSSEGQSDYFATLDCAKKYFSLPEVVQEFQPEKVDSEVQELCEDTDFNNKQTIVCIRSLYASKELVEVYNDIYAQKTNASKVQLSLKSKDSKIVSRTINAQGAYPGLQCRLDTLKAGAFCHKKTEQNYIACDGKEKGRRPSCWYHAP